MKTALTVRFSPKVHDLLAQAAAREDTSMSAYVRDAVYAALLFEAGQRVPTFEGLAKQIRDLKRDLAAEGHDGDDLLERLVVMAVERVSEGVLPAP